MSGEPRETPKEYEVRVIADVFSIPVERMGAFCLDLMEWHRILSNTASVAGPGFRLDPARDVFRWRDDGIHGLREINIHFQGAAPPSEPGTEEE